MIAGDCVSPSRFSHVSMLHASLGSIQRGLLPVRSMDPWEKRSWIVFRVKTKFNKKTAQTRPGHPPALRALPGPRLCIGAPRVQFLAFMWPHRAMSQARAPVAHIASALHGRRLIPSAEDAPQTRPSAARKSRGTQTMRDRKRCGIEHACACAEQWQANQTKRPLPPKGDDDHVMMCSTQKVEVRKKRDFSRGE